MPRSTSRHISHLAVAVLGVVVFAVMACLWSTPTPERPAETPIAVADTPERVAPESTPPQPTAAVIRSYAPRTFPAHWM